MNYIDFEAFVVTVGNDVFTRPQLYKKGDDIKTYI